MKNIAIIGSGGQCRAILGVLSTLDLVKPIVIYDLNEPFEDESIMGISVKKIPTNEELFESRSSIEYILAIGNNEERKILYNKLIDLCCEVLSVISPSAIISCNANLGKGVVIFPNSFVGPLTIIGNNTIINTAAIVEHETIIGDHSHLAPSSVICGRSTISNSCFIGANAVIIEKVSIASNTIIGAGSVVTKSIETEGSTWVGSPVKKIH